MKAAHRQPEPLAPTPDQPLSGPDVPDQAPQQIGFWPLDRPFPALLTLEDMRLVFGSRRGPLSKATYHRRRALGHFRRFEVADVAGVRFSGAKVRAYALGQAETHALTFGAKRGPLRIAHAGGSR